MKVDTVKLTELINKCIDLSMDGRLNSSEQKAFLAQSKRMRGYLLNLLTAEFDDDTPQVLTANNKIKKSTKV
jgi:hypothetical protein